MRARITAYARAIIGRRRIAAELDEELRFHLEQEIDALVARGLTHGEARRRALREFGGVVQTREAVHAVRATWLDAVWRDVRYALRRLAREPVFTLAAVCTLALGIGANTAIFSIVDALMLRTLPVRDPDRLVLVTPGGARTAWTNPLWEHLRDHTDVLAGLAAWSTRGVDPTRADGFDLSTAGGAADVARGLWVSGGFFDVLGVPPLLGRTLTPADDVRGGGPDGLVAVISYACWQRRFGGAADIIGKPIAIERIPFHIVGVTPPAFLGPSAGTSFDVAIPIGTQPIVARRDRLDQRTWWWLNVMGRLAPGQTPQAATQAFARLQPRLRDATRPPSLPPQAAAAYFREPIAVTPAPAGPSPVRDAYERPLAALTAIVALVLLIACINIANLLLARADSRRREASLRLALGASRGRLLSQHLVESLVLAAIGATLGLALAMGSSRWLVAQLASGGGAVVLDLALDWRVLTFTAGLSIAATLLFGLVPALRATSVAPMSAIKGSRTNDGSGAAGGTGHGANRIGGALVAFQVALSLVLVVTALLFVRTFASLVATPRGFDTDRLLIVDVDARRSASPPSDRLALYNRLLEAARRVPGVAEAAFSSVTPVSGSPGNSWDTIIDNRPGASLPERDRRIFKNVVSPRWFATYGTPIVAGRDFSPLDQTPTPSAVIVNETLARRYFGGTGEVIGRTLREAAEGGESPPALTIVGVAKDAVYASLRETPPPTMYVPAGFGFGSIAIRAQDDAPARLGPSVTAALVDVDRDLALTIRPLADDVRAAVARERLLAWLAGCFGLLALLLAAVGLYGTVAYAVSARRAEIGIRMALGATSARTVALVVRRVAVHVAIGVAAGAVASVWGGRFAAALLFGVGPRDPGTLALAIAILLVDAVAASWLPARRATRVDPTIALRSE